MILHLAVYFHFHNSKIFIRIQLIIPNNTLSYLPASIMHMFLAVFGKLLCDVTDDKEAQRDWDFPFIHICI